MADNPFSGALDSIKSIISKVAGQEERREPGPGDVTPSYETKRDAPAGPDNPQGPQLVTLKMSAEECRAWWDRVERSRARIKAREDKWDLLLKEYQPIISASGEPETVKVQKHFRNVHSKIGTLFYRSPDLILTPRDPGPLQAQMPNPMGPQAPPLTMEDIVSVKQALLHQTLGRDGIKANRLMDELLFDVLAWAGFGASKLGYRCVFKTIQQPKLGSAPVPTLPSPESMGNPLGMGGQPPPSMAAPAQPQLVPQLDEMGQPIMESVPVPVHEEWYWRRFSPKKALWNDDLRSTRFDEDATWTGMEFFMSPKKAMAVFKLTEEEANKAAEDDRLYSYKEDKQGTKAPGLVRGVELFCKASVFTDEVHPLAMNQLVLIEGLRERPVVWRPSPDQDFDEKGKLTKDSLLGFPIRILTVRDMADSSFPIADSGFTNSSIKQLSTWRRQSIQLRDAAIGKYFYDQGAFEDTEITVLKSSEVGAYIGVKPGLLGANGGKDILVPTAQIHTTQDDFRNQDLFSQEIDETLGISPVQAGVQLGTVRSATEVDKFSSAALGRSDKELGRTVEFYLDGARMIDQLLMRYADEEDYVQITGADGAKRMQLWNNQMISGRYLYDIAPDSVMKADTAQDFQLFSSYWNLVAKHPQTNTEYLLRRFARLRGLDPAKAVIPKQMMPQPPPDKGKFSLTVSGEDLANPLVVKMLIDNGIIKPEDVALNQPVMKQEGAADKADVVSKHEAGKSGGKENAPGASNFRGSQPGD